MRNRFVHVVVLSLVVASCTKSAHGQLPTPAMLSDSLPTITDMPGSWRETQRQAFDVRGPENPSLDPSVWCADSADATGNLVEYAGQAGADVEMQFLGTAPGPRLMRLQAWANENAGKYLTDATSAARICDGATSTDSSGAVSTTTVIANRDIGDESVSWAQTVTPPPGTQKDKMESMSRTTLSLIHI